MENASVSWAWRYNRYKADEFDMYFERAVQEAERVTYTIRQKYLEQMNPAEYETSSYAQLMRMQTEVCQEVESSILNGMEIRSAIENMMWVGTPQRYWQYVYAVQSQAYREALEKAEIDVDDIDNEYCFETLVSLFKEHYPLLEIFPPAFPLMGLDD